MGSLKGGYLFPCSVDQLSGILFSPCPDFAQLFAHLSDTDTIHLTDGLVAEFIDLHHDEVSSQHSWHLVSASTSVPVKQ